MTAQLAANDGYKRALAGPSGELSVPARLASGAAAGMTATALTHPLDVLRLRLALPGRPRQGARGAWWVWQQGGRRADRAAVRPA